ncbi:MAG: hypothetical protein R3C97_07570 [Geminicoccaceae bacterium]
MAKDLAYAAGDYILSIPRSRRRLDYRHQEKQLIASIDLKYALSPSRMKSSSSAFPSTGSTVRRNQQP